jgi:hypothetical protein
MICIWALVLFHETSYNSREFLSTVEPYPVHRPDRIPFAADRATVTDQFLAFRSIHSTLDLVRKSVPYMHVLDLVRNVLWISGNFSAICPPAVGPSRRTKGI